MIIFTSCCGPHKREQTPRAPDFFVGAVGFITPADITSEQRGYLIDAAETHVREFEKDYGFPSRPTIATIVTANFINCPDYANNTIYTGCYMLPMSTITVIAGQKLEIPSLYHELWHLNSPDGDLNHSHPDWAKRNLRGQQIANMLSNTRPASIRLNNAVRDNKK